MTYRAMLNNGSFFKLIQPGAQLTEMDESANTLFEEKQINKLLVK